MKKQIQITIGIGRSEPLSTSECEQAAQKFMAAVSMIDTQIRGGAYSIPLRIEVGDDPVIEDSCRICGRTRSELAKLRIDLHAFDPTHHGVRPTMEAANPAAPRFFDCGCLDRAAADKAAADRRELDRRNPVAPPYLPAPKAATTDEIDALRRQSATSGEVDELRKRLAALEAKG
jgi:hypothetical protein